MTQAQWVELSFTVRDQMTHRVRPSVTPISRSDDLKRGWAWGTGTYLSLPSGNTVVLTNEHVARQIQTEHLSHLPALGGHYELLTEFKVRPAPEDFAVCSVPADRLGGDRVVLTMDCLDTSFRPEQGELLYWYGVPGTKASRHEPVSEQNTRYSWFEELQTVGLPMLSQQVPDWPDTLPEAYVPEYHAVVHYPAQAKQTPDGVEVDLPNPRGLSGSLLWDTKAVACGRRGEPWEPPKARVCGVIWATWDKPEVVVATKVEFLRAFIADVDTTESA
jgi:hypothetical protein